MALPGKNKQRNRYILPIILYAAVNLLLFSSSYFYIKPLVRFLSYQSILLINVLVSLFIGLKLQTNIVKKLLFIIAASLCSSFVGFLLIFSTMFLPGSREHNYVMYRICMPQIEQYYKDHGLNRGSPDQLGKDRQYRWWYQHLECEQNVREGKGPIFSDTPPGFIPVVK